MVATVLLAALLGLIQSDPEAPSLQETTIPGATGSPYVGEWVGMTSAIYNGEWVFLHKSPSATTYMSRAGETSSRSSAVNSNVTIAFVLAAPDQNGKDMRVAVINYQCTYEKVAIMQVQEFRGTEPFPPQMALPKPRSWANTGGVEVAAKWLCGGTQPSIAEPVVGLGSLRRDAARRPLG